MRGEGYNAHYFFEITLSKVTLYTRMLLIEIL